MTWARVTTRTHTWQCSFCRHRHQPGHGRDAEACLACGAARYCNASTRLGPCSNRANLMLDGEFFCHHHAPTTRVAPYATMSQPQHDPRRSP